MTNSVGQIYPFRYLLLNSLSPVAILFFLWVALGATIDHLVQHQYSNRFLPNSMADFYGGGVLELNPTEFKKLPMVYNQPSNDEFSTIVGEFPINREKMIRPLDSGIVG